MKKLVVMLLFSIGALAQGTYYIDSAATDNTANGTAKVSPWKCAPGMYCNAIAGHAGYVHVAGDHFIFKGNTTWGSTLLPLVIQNSGVNGTPDYYGVDATWFAGGAFANPIFDGGYVDLSGQASGGLCASQSNVVCSSNANYFTFDSINVTGELSDTNLFRGLMQLNGAGATGIIVKNLTLSGWQLSSTFTSSSSFCTTPPCRCDDKHGGLITNGPIGVQVQNVSIDNTANNTTALAYNCTSCANGYAFHVGGGGTSSLTNVTIHDSVDGALASIDSASNLLFYNVGKDALGNAMVAFDHTFTNQCAVAHQNHSNVLFTNNGGTYNNIAIINSTSGSQAFFPNICHNSLSSTQLTLSNFYFEDGIQIDPSFCNGTTIQGNVSLYNGTIKRQSTGLLIASRGSTQPVSTLTIKNLHIINDRTTTKPVCYTDANTLSATCSGTPGYAKTINFTPFSAYVAGGVLSGAEKNLWESTTDAATDGYSGALTINGYTLANGSAPTVITGKGVAAGFSLSSEYPTASPDIRDVPRTPSWDIGAYQFFAGAASYTVTASCAGTANGTIIGSAGSVMNAVCTAGVCSGTCSESITAGNSGTYTGAATTGSMTAFTIGACIASPCTVTVNTPLTVSATFQTAITCTLTLAANSLNSPTTVAATTSLTGLSGPNSLWFVLDPLSVAISVCNYPYSGCAAAGQSGNLPYTVSGLYSLGACSNGVCCTGSTAPLNINTGAGSAAH